MKGVKVRRQVLLEENFAKKLEEMARKNEVSLSALIRMLIRAGLETIEEDKK